MFRDARRKVRNERQAHENIVTNVQSMAHDPELMDQGLADDLRHLVLVACHAIYLGGDPAEMAADSNWCVREFQRGEPPFYLQHIEEGVRAGASDASALIVFSGGQSRLEAGPRSEGASYRMAASRSGWWQHPDVEIRTTTEEFARDSFENLLFGICRFFEVTRRMPEHISVVSWSFKRRRFDWHRQAIRFPETRFRFVGPNDPVDVSRARRGEASTLRAFEADPYGTGPLLRQKRDQRNPFRRIAPYQLSCPELAGLLTHAGPVFYEGWLPWR